MLAKLLSHARHNIVGYLALFVALGGTAMAAKPMLTGADIQDGTINSADLRDRGAAGYPGPSIQGIDLEANTLTGAEILESTLGQVPSASDADKLGGTNASSYLKSGDTAGGDLAGQYPNPTLAQPEPWHAIGPATGAPCGSSPGGTDHFCAAGLSNFGSGANTTAYFKDPFGIVHLKGTVKNSAATTEHQLFYLPEGYRPAGDGAYAVAKGNDIGIVDVLAGGGVIFVNSIFGNSLAQNEAVSLDGLNFRAE